MMNMLSMVPRKVMTSFHTMWRNTATDIQGTRSRSARGTLAEEVVKVLQGEETDAHSEAVDDAVEGGVKLSSIPLVPS